MLLMCSTPIKPPCLSREGNGGTLACTFSKLDLHIGKEAGTANADILKSFLFTQVLSKFSSSRCDDFQ